MLEFELQTACSQTYEKKKLAVEKEKILGKVFIHSQFNSAPLIWMFCSKNLSLKIENHKTLRIVHHSNVSYLYLLECNGSTSFHQGHLLFSLTEIYKSTVNTNLIFM